MTTATESGTETTEVKTGQEQENQNALEQAAPETATEKAGEPTEEEKAAAAEAEAAAKRERETRENTPGTVEYLEKRVEKEKEARKKMGITLSKAEERALRAEERAKVLEEMLEKSGTKGQPKKGDEAETAKDKPLARPRMSQFDSEDEYNAAMDAYESAKEEQIINKAREKARAELDQSRTKSDQEKAAEDWGKRVSGILKAGQTDYEDFDDVTHSENLSLTPAMVSAIVDLEAEAHHVEYFLGKNKAEQERIAALTPARQVMEIGRLSDKLRGARAVKRETNAKPPLKPLNGGAQPTDDARYASDEISTEDRITLSRQRRGLKT